MPPCPGLDDSRLAAELLDRRPGALAQVYDGYGPWLYDYAHALLADQARAAEALRSALTVAARRDTTVPEATRLRRWLYILVRQECLARLDAGTSTPSARPAPDTVSTQAEHPERLEQARQTFQAVLDDLDDLERELTHLALRHTLKIPELAEILGLPPQDTAELLATTQARIAQSLGDHLGREIDPDQVPTALESLPFPQPPADLADHLEITDSGAHRVATWYPASPEPPPPPNVAPDGSYAATPDTQGRPPDDGGWGPDLDPPPPDPTNAEDPRVVAWHTGPTEPAHPSTDGGWGPYPDPGSRILTWYATPADPKPPDTDGGWGPYDPPGTTHPRPIAITLTPEAASCHATTDTADPPTSQILHPAPTRPKAPTTPEPAQRPSAASKLPRNAPVTRPPTTAPTAPTANTTTTASTVNTTSAAGTISTASSTGSAAPLRDRDRDRDGSVRTSALRRTAEPSRRSSAPVQTDPAAADPPYAGRFHRDTAARRSDSAVRPALSSDAAVRGESVLRVAAGASAGDGSGDGEAGGVAGDDGVASGGGLGRRLPEGAGRRVGYVAGGVVVGVGLVLLLAPGAADHRGGAAGLGVGRVTESATSQGDDSGVPSFQPGGGVAPGPSGGPTDGRSAGPQPSKQVATTPPGKAGPPVRASATPTRTTGGVQAVDGHLAVDDGGCGHVFAAALAGSCLVRLSAVGGSVHWAVASVQSGSARLSAGGSGTLAKGSSVSVRVVVRATVACYATGFGSGSVTFTPGGTATINYTCW